MIIVEIELLIIGDKTEIKKYINRFRLKLSRRGEFVVQIYLLSGALGFFECSLNAVRFLFCFSY